MSYRSWLILIVVPLLFNGVAGQAPRSAWDLLLSEDPELDEASIGWQERLILQALTPEQAQLYFSDQMSAEELILPSGQSLAAYLEERRNPPAHVYIPMATPCRLFAFEDVVAGDRVLQVRGEGLALQGGSVSGCPIPPEAGALLIQLEIESYGGIPARVQLWAPDFPEPATTPVGSVDFGLSESYETMRVVPLCRSRDCLFDGLQLRLSEVAAVSGEVVGYFRAIGSADQPGSPIPLATEGSSNNFFGTGAGANNTGNANSFFGGNAGNANTSGSFNSFFGEEAGLNNTTGSQNSFFGENAGRSNDVGAFNSFFGTATGEANTSGSENAFFGAQAGSSNTTGSFNSFFGDEAGFSNTDGTNNSFFGEDAGLSNTSGSFNSMFGAGAGDANTTGAENAFFGAQAGTDNTTGSFNAFFGDQAGLNNTTGMDNAFFGEDAGILNTIGTSNSFFGRGAGRFNNFGSSNAFFGEQAGISNTSENNNTFLGARSNGADSITNATAVGFRAQVSQSNSLVLGSINGLNGANSSVRVGIGTAIPVAPLHVFRSDGTVQIIRAQSTGPETVRNMMDLINNGIPQFRLVDTSADGDAWQFSNTNNNLNISLQGSGSQEFLIENDGDVFINNGTVQVTSSRETKENFKISDAREILRRLAQLDISEWNYKKDPGSVRHIGPVSEDFYRLFGFGDGDKHITPTDLSGVALAAIQGLLEQNEKLSRELTELREEVQALRTTVAQVPEVTED